MDLQSAIAKAGGGATPKDMNPLRTSVRFPLRLPVRLQMAGRQMDATTEDISASGALLSMTELPTMNARIEWSLCLPADVMGAERDVNVHCVGRVVRHDSDDLGGKLVGVLIDEYTFKDGPQ